MISLSLIILIFGIIVNRTNFLKIFILLELIYLLLGYLLISFNMDLFVIIVLGLAGAESCIGLSILLSYYLSTNK